MDVNLNNYSLLIVDDDEDLKNTLCEFFRDEGANVYSASNGEEALQITIITKIDLILSDIRMPIMDGVELLKTINVVENHTPIVWLMTGQSDLKEEVALEMGAEGLLNKPFKLQLVLDKIKYSLAKNR